MNQTLAFNHAALGRRLALGDRTEGRQLGVLGVATFLALAASLTRHYHGPVMDGVLAGMLAALAGLWSAKGTLAALGAQRVMGAHLLPHAALLRWRQGWLQAQGLMGVSLGAFGAVLVGWHGASVSQVITVVCLGQVAGVMTALALAGRAPRVWLLLPWASLAFWSVLLDQARQPTPVLARLPAAMPWLAVAALLAAVWGAAWAWRCLSPSARIERLVRPIAGSSAIGRFLARWVSLEPSSNQQRWHLVFSSLSSWWIVIELVVLWPPASSVEALNHFGPNRLLVMLGMLIFLEADLVTQRLHWRHFLLPRSPLRQHLGRHIFSQSLLKLMLTGLVLLAGSVLIVRSLGFAWASVGQAVLKLLPFGLDMVCMLALAVLWRGHIQSRGSSWQQQTLWRMGLLAVVCLLTIDVFVTHYLPPVWADTGWAYDLTLLGLTAALLSAADRVWARCDLSFLTRKVQAAP